MTRTQKVFTWIVLALPLGLMVPFVHQFAYPLHSAYSDVTVSHFPNLAFLQQSLITAHRLPFWSDTILSGYPFFANPLSGMWYPPLWLALLLRGATGINLVVMLHLYLGAWGMMFFLRAEKISWWAALAGGIAFALMPKIHAHFAAGHITMVCAVMWTPWLLWFEKKRNEAGWGIKAPAGSGVVLGLIALADLRWAAYAGALWLGFRIYQHWFVEGQPRPTRTRGSFLRWLADTDAILLLALGISAPLLVPLAEYSPLTTRQYLTAADNLSYALPAERILTLLFPDIGGYAEWVIYPGAAIVLFFVWGVLERKTWQRHWFWLGVFGVSSLYAFGAAFPPNRWIAQLPGFSLLRVPSRALFVSNLAVIYIACDALARLMAAPVLEKTDRRIPYGLLGTGAVVLMAISLSLGLWVMMGSVPVEMILATIVYVGAFLVLGVLRKSGIPQYVAGGILLAFLVLDLGTINHASTSYWSYARATGEGAPAAAFLAEQEGVFRVYSPSYSIPQQTAAIYGLSLADGIDPLQLSPYAGYMAEATGVDVPGYSVTLPPFASGKPDTDNADAIPHADLLGRLNVRYLAAEFDITAAGFLPIARFGETRIYENQLVYPRIWVERDEETPGGEIVSVHEGIVQPDYLSALATGPGTVVVSELAYPGWRVKVDGQLEEMRTISGIFRGVDISAGAHEVVFFFRPVSAYIGIGIGLLVWMLVAVLFFRPPRIKRT